jgi:DNA repair ATPase RecN
MKINRFIDTNVMRISVFEEMINKVSKKTHLTRSTISNVGEIALQSWEDNENQDPARLLFSSKENRLREISKMISEFKKQITPIIKSPEKIGESLDIFQDTLKKMFELQEF